MHHGNRAFSLCLRKILLLAFILIFILQSHALIKDQASEFDKLEAQLFKHFKKEKFEDALDIAMKMYELNPKHVNTLYNIAILHRKLGNKEKAYEWFEKAAEAGGLRSFRRSYFERYIAMLEHKDRDAFQKPDQIITALAIKPGEHVADIGAGSGYFTLRLAKAVGPEGTVWAVDIERAMLDHIEARLEEMALQNVTLQHVPADDPQLPAGKLNTILLVHTYAYLPNRSEYAKKLRTALAHGGRVVIIEYIPASWEKRPWGPLPHQQVSRKTTDTEMAKAGFTPSSVHDFLPGQYFVEYKIQEKK